MNPESLPTLLKAKEVAEFLTVNVRTVWRWNSSGQIPKPVKLGGSVRWVLQELEKWLAERRANRSAR